MEIILIIAITLFLATIAVFFVINKKLSEMKKPEDDKSLMILQQRMEHLSQIMDQKLSETNRLTKSQLKDSNQLMQEISKGLSKESRELFTEINRQFNEMAKHSHQSIRQVTEKITTLDETNKKVVDFSSQLKNLQDILKNPKQRGVLGEYYLEETLKNVLPPHNYQMQYKFKDGNAVDAAIFVKDKVIPVDSKFSLENYEKLMNCKEEEREFFEKQLREDLKRRIDETAKYIQPKEKTTDFAFMFIPSESVYYDLLTNKIGAGASSRDLIEYGFQEKHVVIVSPTSFMAYLQTVLQGLRSLQIEESAKKIQKNVEKLSTHLKNYETYFNKVGNSLSTTVNHYNKANKELSKIDKDVTKVTDGSGKKLELNEGEIEKPKSEE
ncbi:MAG: DNA recombination protein RmuC [Candidatus Moraniibacteriota bacterium]